MRGWNNPAYSVALLLSNAVALVILFCCWKYPRTARLLFFLLFGWAGCINWYTALHSPQDYIAYSELAFLPFYTSFIKGWFSGHVLLIVGFIATGQLLIALAMWAKGWIFKLGTLGGLAFLLGILPLGVGAGFPFPILAAAGFCLLYRNPAIDYLWKGQTRQASLHPTEIFPGRTQ